MDFSALDFQVGDAVRDLASEVEGLWGREIPLELAEEGSDPYRYIGAAETNRDSVRILAGFGFDEYSLAHELMHLKRYGSGIPRTVPAKDSAGWSNGVENPLEHKAIYPALQGMGLGTDPFTDEGYWTRVDDDFHSTVARLQGPARSGTQRLFVTILVHALLCCRRRDTVRSLQMLAEVANERLYHLAKDLATSLMTVDISTAEGKREALGIMKVGLNIPGRLPLVRLVPTPPPAEWWYDATPFGEA